MNYKKITFACVLLGLSLYAGILGEVQLAALLEQVFTPQQREHVGIGQIRRRWWWRLFLFRPASTRASTSGVLSRPSASPWLSCHLLKSC